MPELNWRLRVWTPTGSGPRIIQRDTGPIPIPGEASHIQGLGGRGLRLRITPEGECVEAVFSARGSGILLPPLSAVQVEYLYLGNWTPLYYGEVRRGGNARDVYGEDYAIVGMSRRLEEVTLSPGFSTPEQAAHLTVRAIIQDVLASGQLGSPALVQYVESLCPDLGFNCRKIVDAAQQDPASLLEQITQDGAKYGVVVRWGVDPQRRFFCVTAKSDTRDVTAEAPVIRWNPPVAETPCTAVLWYVKQKPDKSWVTHLSVSPDAATYGLRIKRVAVSSDVPAYGPVPLQYRERLSDGGGAPFNVYGSRPDAGDRAVLTDGNDAGTTLNLGATPGTPTARVAMLEAYSPAARFYHYSVRTDTSSTTAWIGMKPWDDSTLARATVVATPYTGGGIRVLDEQYILPGQAWFVMTDPAGASDPNILVNELRAEGVYADVLDGLAQYHYSSPAQEPADVETVVFVPPVSLPGRVRVMPPSGAVYEHPLEAVEYRITSKGMQMGYLAGQADDPAALAQASLIKKRDGQAVITAITSGN